jgi:hypothetical protein
MMEPLEMKALVGTNPLGFLAALGVLYCADQQRENSDPVPRLSWSDHVEPHALLWGVEDEDELFRRLEDERRAVLGCVALNWPSDYPLPTAKASPEKLRGWAEACFHDDDPRSGAIFNALVAEGAHSGKGEAKPTHLDFTAGQQRLLTMVRQLGGIATKERMVEALNDWEFFADAPSLALDSADERIYALRASNPSGEKKASVPGANWLAFLGWVSLPVMNKAGALRTVGCGSGWKRSTFTWLLQAQPMTRQVIEAALRGGAEFLSERSSVTASIKRTDQGGYGSFSGIVIEGVGSQENGTNPLLRKP